ncbi:MAG: hypothetical protein QOJ62_2066 [Actinomycetota bacterium]|jgi:hypothetical protein|nr:hypothetical protein [Actinomycetota bacterium]
MATDPEELLRSIERTREELARTVDTIAVRLDPKRAAKRGADAVRGGVVSVLDGARSRLHIGPDAAAGRVASPASSNGTSAVGRGAADVTSSATSVKAGVAAKLAQVPPLARRVPKPAVGAGMAALLALAAIIAARRRRR